MNPDVIILQLNHNELEIALRRDPTTASDGGYQSLMVSLQVAIDKETKQMRLPVDRIPRLKKYAFNYGNGGWENRITSIFSRHLGPNLDQIPS